LPPRRPGTLSPSEPKTVRGKAGRKRGGKEGQSLQRSAERRNKKKKGGQKMKMPTQKGRTRPNNHQSTKGGKNTNLIV